jgi:hypothetical protein
VSESFDDVFEVTFDDTFEDTVIASFLVIVVAVTPAIRERAVNRRPPVVAEDVVCDIPNGLRANLGMYTAKMVVNVRKATATVAK